MTPLGRLDAVLAGFDAAAVAVSGGIDSLTLATAAHRALGIRVTMHHATSPAVPAEATARTRALAAAQGWALDVFDAGEFADPAPRRTRRSRSCMPPSAPASPSSTIAGTTTAARARSALAAPWPAATATACS